MSGNATIATSETKIEALKLQSSAYGVTIPVLGGVNRIPGNLVWYGGFKAIPQTTTARTGKGGIKTQNTTYTYSASVVMGICQGPVGAIARVWKGKEVYTGGWSAAAVVAASETYTPPGSGAMTYTLANGATLIGAPTISYTETITINGESTSWTETAVVQLAMGTDWTLSAGVVTILAERVRGLALTIRYQRGSGSPDLSPLTDLSISLANGDMAQTVPAWLSSSFASQALAYPGLAYVHAQDYNLGTGAQVDNHSFEVQGFGAYRYGSTQPDCNLAEFAADVLTNGRWGARLRAETVDAQDWITYCAAAGLLMSPVLSEQTRAGEFIERACQLSNTAPVWSFDRLRLVPYADAAITGNSVTYTPNTTPLYDIDDSFYLQDGAEDPLQWTVKEPSDRYNHVRVEFSDRSNYYNKTIAEAKDDADISLNGLRTMATIAAPWICTAEVARLVAQLALQRSLNISGTGRLKLPWAFSLLECMDLITLTDAALGFSAMPVRITAIGEDEDGDLELEVEDWPLGTASATRYPSQAAAGFQHDYNAAPGNAATPVIFELPTQLATDTGLQLAVAVRGSGSNWGGCQVWVSLDGTNYSQAGTVYGGARYGTLSTTVGSTVGVQGLGTAQLLSGSAADATALQTLCYIGGASPEYLAYQTATLVSAGAYTLGGLVRNGFGTATAAHSVGDPFVRVDDSIVKSQPLALSFIGSTIYLKFCSFNVYGGAQQGLADVSAVTYTITGAMAQLAPSNVAGLSATGGPGMARISWTPNAEGDYSETELRLGASWAAGTLLARIKGSTYPWAVAAAGTYSIWAKHLDSLGNASVTAAGISVTVTAAGVASWSSIIDKPADSELLNLQGTYAVAQAWNFNGSAEGWTATNATAAAGGLALLVTSTGTDPQLTSPAISINGAAFFQVRARIKRAAGTAWDGKLFYATAGHGFSASFVKTVSDTTVTGEWVVVEWDMSNLTVGGSDWLTSTITQIRLDLGASAADIFDIDWIGIGTSGPASYGAEWGKNVIGSAAVDAAISTAQSTATTAQSTATAASSAAAAAQTSANTANAAIANIVSDNVLARGEKSAVILEWTTISQEQAGIDAQATAYGITTEKTDYDNAISTLSTYLGGLSPAWNDTSQDTTIVGTTFRANFAAVYAKRQALLDQIASLARSLANAAQATANTASTNATAAQSLLATMRSNGYIDAAEKPALMREWNYIVGEYGPLSTQAGAYSITTEKATYDNAYSALSSYLSSLSPSWNDTSSDTPITPAVDAAKWSDYYNARGTLTKRIAEEAGKRSIWSGTTGRPTNLASLVGTESLLNNENSIIRSPGGGVFVSTAATQTGCLRIRLPQYFTDTMMRFIVDIFEYGAGLSCSLEIAGYTNSSAPNWLQVTARVVGDATVEYPVRFGHDGTRACVWIGNASDTWSYPQVRVRDWFGGFQNYSAAQWESGWAVTFEPAGTFNVTATVLDTLPGADLTKGKGAVVTTQIAANAATAINIDDYDFGGTSFGTTTARTYTVTPAVDCWIEFTARVEAATIDGDSGKTVGWWVVPSGGSAVALGGSSTPGTQKKEVTCVNAFAATGGVALTFEIRTSNGGSSPNPVLYKSIMRVTQIKR